MFVTWLMQSGFGIILRLYFGLFFASCRWVMVVPFQSRQQLLCSMIVASWQPCSLVMPKDVDA
ncbi:hypothetical protein Pint_28676 [Pistacia integerrima]|uniref:Uncharacterized protein n=1 Tax=Pistacia integerrima TaxID=434235 RepID=A0ACC0YNU6_9ROSI|nr:hypothetical protein Pint_28676 [Pistacia integerrima]